MSWFGALACYHKVNMTSTLSPSQLLVELQAITTSSPELIRDPDLRAQICIAAEKAYRRLEQPADVVARVFLSQVSLLRLCQPTDEADVFCSR